jgi:hypothetical protein
MCFDTEEEDMALTNDIDYGYVETGSMDSSWFPSSWGIFWRNMVPVCGEETSPIKEVKVAGEVHVTTWQHAIPVGSMNVRNKAYAAVSYI